MKLANEKGFVFLMGGDFNARNVIYGSKTTDKRGKIFEDILIANNLYTLNVGTIPTSWPAAKGRSSTSLRSPAGWRTLSKTGR